MDAWQPILDALLGAGIDPSDVAIGTVDRWGYTELRHPDARTTITVDREWPSPVSPAHVERILIAEQIRPR